MSWKFTLFCSKQFILNSSIKVNETNCITYWFVKARRRRELLPVRLSEDHRPHLRVPDADHVLRRRDHFTKVSVSHTQMGRRRGCRSKALGELCVVFTRHKYVDNQLISNGENNVHHYFCRANSRRFAITLRNRSIRTPSTMTTLTRATMCLCVGRSISWWELNSFSCFTLLHDQYII